MRTDRSPIFSGSCECGAGAEEIEFCTPDHGWSSSSWYEASVRCPTCSKKYELRCFGKGFYRVLITEIAAKEVKKKQAYEDEKTLKNKAKEKGVVQAFIGLLNDQPSGAARYRMLSNAGLVHCSLATFRKNWSGAQSWVGQYSGDLQPSCPNSCV